MSSSPSILIVEDDAMLSLIFLQLLTGAGYDVHLWSEETDIISTIRELQPQLVVLDLHLPQIPGWKLLERLWTDLEHAAPPVLVCSGNLGVVSAEQLVHLRQQGGDVIAKPFALAEMLEKVQALVAVTV